MDNKYKFENFENPNFPVYSSVQAGDGLLVIPHFHKAAELIMVTDGKAEMMVDTMHIKCKKGDIVFIPPYSFHNVNGIGKITKITGLLYEFDLINVNVPDIRFDEILNKERISDFVFDDKSSVYEMLSNAFTEATEAYCADKYTSKMDILSPLYRITSTLLERYSLSSDADKNAMYDRVKPVIEYINENYTNKIYISDLGNLLHVCDDHLIRLFKSVTNKSPVQYITDKRVEKAMKMLIDTDLSVYEIADRVGFSNANYMSNTFKSSIGMTPYEYRNKLKGKI